MKSHIHWSDVKLGIRMLLKHPALTLVGGLGMAVAVAINVGVFSFVVAYIYPTLPLDDGDRIVALENRDIAENEDERRSLHDSLCGVSSCRQSRISPPSAQLSAT